MYRHKSCWMLRSPINNKYYIALLVHLKEEIAKKTTTKEEEEKVLVHQDNAPCHKSITMMAKLHRPYSPNLAPSDYWLLADLKRMLQGKRFRSNEEVILETEAKDKSFYKKMHQIFEKRWNWSPSGVIHYVDE